MGQTADAQGGGDHGVIVWSCHQLTRLSGVMNPHREIRGLQKLPANAHSRLVLDGFNL